MTRFNGSQRSSTSASPPFGFGSGLAPVRKVSGTATLIDKRLQVTPTGGTIKSVQVTGGSLDITDLGAPVEWQTIDLNLAGPIRDVLEVIDVKPLRYAHDIGVDPARVAGRTEFNLHFKFPLLRSLKFDDVEYGVRATLTGTAITRAAIDRDLSDLVVMRLQVVTDGATLLYRVAFVQVGIAQPVPIAGRGEQFERRLVLFDVAFKGFRRVFLRFM